MNQTIPFLTLQVDPENGLRFAKDALTTAGLVFQRSFDLQVARAAHTGCTCPHHGTEHCTCQMVVLLVYGEGPTPATLVVHGKGGTTHFTLVDVPESRLDGALMANIQEALKEQALKLRSSREWSHVT